jgi:TatD DNase family protein
VSLEAWDKVFALAQQHEEFYCTVGVHPDYEFAREPTAEVLIARAKLPKVVAIGECGLDFYQQPQGQIWQEKRFENHLLASRISQKPLVIHSRDSGKRMLEMLKFHQASPMDGGAGGVLHCFTDTWEIAKGALDMGFYLSFSGIVTFKNAKALHEVAKKTPEDRFVIETDSPYLAPHPHRGKLNHPALVLHVAEHLSQLRGVPLVDIAKQSTLNAERLFRLPALGH